jgi:hypothetical protein
LLIKLVDLDPTVARTVIERGAETSKMALANLYLVLFSQKQATA